MKKKTIATSLLAILVSTYATPFVSNAETISGATKDTTEQVAPTAESEAPTTESEAPATKDEVKAPTTKEAPAAKTGAQTRDLSTHIENYRAEVRANIESAFKNKEITEPQYLALLSDLISAADGDAIEAVADQLEADKATTLTANNQAAVDEAKLDADNKIQELIATGDVGNLTSGPAKTAQNAVNTAYGLYDGTNKDKVISDIEAAVAKLQAQADAKALKRAQTAAKNELPGLVADGKLPSADYYDTLQKIEAATTVAEVEAIMEAIKNPTNGGGTENPGGGTENPGGGTENPGGGTTTTLDQAKQSAKDVLFTWLSYGQINDSQYVNGINAINAATTPEEVQAVIEDIKNQIVEEVQNTLAQIKQDAKDQLFAWFTDGSLTAQDYAFYLSQVIAAQDAEEVAAIIANADQQINENGMHFDLEAYKEEARNQLATWLAGGWITEDQYWAYLSLVDVAQDADAVDAAINQLMDEIHNADTLENAQNNATNQLISWLADGVISETQYYTYLQHIADATSVEEVNNIMQNLLNELGYGADSLEFVQNQATNQLVAWLAEGSITEAQYYTYLQRVADATTVAEVNAILDELKAIIEGDVEDVTNKPVGTPSNTNTNNNTNNVLVSVTTTENGGKKATVTTKEVVKTTNAKKAELPKTGETNQNLTALGLMSVALGSLVAVLKRKRS
ncbi:LPXTG cell wall anchor domain-containing protein [Vagococcus bubulae]|uniref:LPXTG cell wall anchor domain-containing protein n=1 Tax=Vagococcus bubulae TaxID=1977868 RepID=UPI0022E86DC9|nr:LPXTG cell wall anchor domain-containing protein [Vagococcus bubulae]